MPALHLVRHGQASFGAGNYDRLSAVGHEQARAVGVALRERGVAPAVVVHGSLRRQRQSAEAIAAAWADAPGGPPPLREDARWDEYDHERLLTALSADPAYAARPGADAAASDPARAFQAALDEALERWTGGAFDEEYAETFGAFGERVGLALDEAVARAGEGDRSGTTVVVSSAGAIGAVVSALLRLDPEAWAALNRVAVNTGITTVVAGARGRSVVTFNDHGHLGGPGRPERTTR
ncbi:histidine phosphatase family protein [Patulibacter americanus]|uniref:histidine phosphatase family protein n=1 Tax=Patulibacter americanus TaxID=588672 RepID=UPI0003B49543|nr:histidine phosphatase family protein [Patulibacter americanus]